jgi:peroxiredoxin
MAIQAGEKMPSGTFGVMTDDGPGAISSDELFGGKKVVLFAVPGAFTPTCSRSRSHLPGFISQADAVLAKGVDTIACMSVNDVFVMHAWGEAQGVGDKVMMLADGNGEYAQALDLVMDASSFGMGSRSQRFAIVVDDGVATHVAVEAPGQLEVSKAESILANL